MTNTVDITNVSEKVLDAFLESKANPEAVVFVDKWTRRERRSLAKMMNWEFNAVTLAWING